MCHRLAAALKARGLEGGKGLGIGDWGLEIGDGYGMGMGWGWVIGLPNYLRVCASIGLIEPFACRWLLAN